MRKYLFGLLAVAFALTAVAFTKPDKTDLATVFFQYVGPATYAEGEIENNANWQEVSNITSGCNNIDCKACRISVNDTETVGTAPNRVLNSTAVINAQLCAAHGTYFVIVAGSVLQKRNKS